MRVRHDSATCAVLARRDGISRVWPAHAGAATPPPRVLLPWDMHVLSCATCCLHGRVSQGVREGHNQKRLTSLAGAGPEVALNARLGAWPGAGRPSTASVDVIITITITSKAAARGCGRRGRRGGRMPAQAAWSNGGGGWRDTHAAPHSAEHTGVWSEC